MLTDPEEIALASGAMEPGLRLANRSTRGPVAIARDFLAGISLKGSVVLELGPGHFEFCDFVRARGGAAAVVELDPAIAAIGRRRGYEVFIKDLRELGSFEPGKRFDGLFCKGSNNPFWFYKDEGALRAYIERFVRLTEPRGWVWVASCPYTSQPTTPAEFAGWLDVERRIYRELGFQEWPIPWRAIGGMYGISIPCDGLSVFTRNLPPHRWSGRSILEASAFTVRRQLHRLLRPSPG